MNYIYTDNFDNDLLDYLAKSDLALNDLIKANRANLVPVKIAVTRNGKTFMQTYWKTPYEAKKIMQAQRAKNPLDVDIHPDFQEYWNKLSPTMKKAIINSQTNTDDRGEFGTLFANCDEKGNLSKEREALHKGILAKFLVGIQSAEGKAKFLMMGGGPACGKGSVQDLDFFKETYPHLPTIDADKIKGEIPEYKADIKNKDTAISRGAAGRVHEESSALVKRLMGIMCDNNVSHCLDGTGDGSIASMKKKIANAREKGMSVDGCYVTIDIKEAYKRAVIRGLQQGRYVPADSFLKTHINVSKVLKEVDKDFDTVRLYDNNVPFGKEPILIATGGNGNHLVAEKGQEAKLQEFFDKANSTVTVDDLRKIHDKVEKEYKQSLDKQNRK